MGDLFRREDATLDVEIGRLDVAVDDASCVRGRQTLERVVQNRRDVTEGQVLLATEPLVETLAFESLEGAPESPVAVIACPEDARDLRRLDVGGGGRLSLEASDEVGVLRCAFVQHLEGHLLACPAIGGVNLSHPSATNQPLHPIDGTDCRTDQRCGFRQSSPKDNTGFGRL